MFFYDSDSIKQEFGNYGLMKFSQVVEPHKNMENKPPFKFLMVNVKKTMMQNHKIGLEKIVISGDLFLFTYLKAHCNQINSNNIL
jgi:hypothetical protein